MERISVATRPNWQERVKNQGFVYHTHDQTNGTMDGTYWHEGYAYTFSEAEIDRIDDATLEAHNMFMRAVDKVISDPTALFGFGIPNYAHEMIRRSWYNSDPFVIGRFDFGYDGKNLKVFEYNADTPTSLVEAAVVQWHWLQDLFPEKAEKGQQFNLIHENLIEVWKHIGASMERSNPNAWLYFSSIRTSVEEYATIEYLRETAKLADIPTSFIHVEDVGLRDDNVFVDEMNREIRFWFKLYPWEWLIDEAWGRKFPLITENVGILEPAWKMVLSNKSLLPVVWEMNKGHPLLLESYFDYNSSLGENFVKKPIWGREGANVEMIRGEQKIVSDGNCGKQAMIYQEMFDMPSFDGNYAQIGSWTIMGKPSGIIIREDDTPLIKTSGRILPHYFT